MTDKTDTNKITFNSAETEQLQGGKCPDKPNENTCGSCPGCSGQRKRYATVYYIIPALVITVIALILKYFGII